MYLKVLFLVGVVGAAGGAYAYHQVTVAKLENAVIQLEANNRTLKENNNVLQEAVENNATKVAELEAHREEQQAQVTELSSKMAGLQKEKNNFLRVFKDHNLTRLARAKPGLIETRVNKKTEAVFRQIEEDSKEIENADD
jgi:uncharacterized protein HemX